MDGKAYVIIGIVLIAIAVVGTVMVQLIMRRWKKRYDAEWDSNL